MDPVLDYCLNLTRRQFFARGAMGVGAGMGVAALGSLLPGGLAQALAGVAGPAAPPAALGQGELGAPHTAPKAKRVIFLHMNGAPSQLDLFDYKPQLRERFNQDLPGSVRGDQRLTGMTSGQSRFPVAPSAFRFDKYKNNEDGLWVSELLPHTAKLAHELCVIKTMWTEAINHDPGVTFFQTGHQQPGRPSIGAWLSYGLGSANANLPAFVVMLSKGYGNTQALYSRLWGTGFLPSDHQGVNFLPAGSPVLYLNDPKGVARDDRRRMLDAVAAINAQESARANDTEVSTRIAQAEMAFRMQMSVPELSDFSTESPETLAAYGPDVKTPGTFAANCLLARRLAERNVRFIQLYHQGWDQHGNLPGEIRQQCRMTDQPCAALLADLRRLGLLDDTLVVWAGEFGRTVYSQGALSRTNYGRDHHPKCFSVWMAGGGVKPGVSWGETDDYSYNILDKATHGMSVHDLHATMLHSLGINHEKLTYRFQGRDYRLTDVAGVVNRKILV